MQDFTESIMNNFLQTYDDPTIRKPSAAYAGTNAPLLW
jgi:hypothetical protein